MFQGLSFTKIIQVLSIVKKTGSPGDEAKKTGSPGDEADFPNISS